MCNIRVAELRENQALQQDSAGWNEEPGAPAQASSMTTYNPCMCNYLSVSLMRLALNVPLESNRISGIKYMIEGWGAAKHWGFHVEFKLHLKTYTQNKILAAALYFQLKGREREALT